MLLYVLLYVIDLSLDLADMLDITGDMTELLVFIVDAVDDDNVVLIEGELFIRSEDYIILSLSEL